MHRLYREIQKDLSGYSFKNTPELVNLFDILGFVMQSGDRKNLSKIEFFEVYSENEVDEDRYTQWLENRNLFSTKEDLKKIQEKTIISSREELLSLVKGSLYCYPIETTYFRKYLKDKGTYKLHIDFEWLENIEKFASKADQIRLKEKFFKAFIKRNPKDSDSKSYKRILANIDKYREQAASS